jgi:low molecular weight protein-tyrosine phosphatase
MTHHAGPPLPPPRTTDGPYRICCVCLGNICRSPMAEVVLRAQLDQAGLAAKVVVDSAGTGDWHIGDTMNGRARDQLARAGYDGQAHRARQIDSWWLPQRDLILAMDETNLRDLRALASAADAGRIRLFGEIADLGVRNVPDPYYGTADDFAAVLALLETGMANLVTELKQMPQLSA